MVVARFEAERQALALLSPRGNTELVARRELEELARQLAREHADGFYDCVGQWFLADPGTRAASPF